MLSRVAECVYWMSRYLERAENTARFVDVNHHLSLDLGGGMREQWEPLVNTTGDHQLFNEHYDFPSQRNVIRFLTFDDRNPNSILTCLRNARENARAVRDIISSTAWEEINKFYLFVRAAAGDAAVLETPHDFLREVRRNCQLVVGVADATMLRDEPWQFAEVGRLIERADKTSRILDVKYYILLPHPTDVGTPLDSVQWAALLKSASALEMYRRSRGRISARDVVDFLMLDRLFPRSIRYCLRQAEESLRAVTGTEHATYCNEAERRLGQLRAALDYATVDDIVEGGIHEYIDWFQSQLNAVGAAVMEEFFLCDPTEEVSQRVSAVQ